MLAKFIGKTSMGFISGKTYDIKFDIQKIRKGGSVFGTDIMCICIYDTNSRAWCPYQSWASVERNWMVL